MARFAPATEAAGPQNSLMKLEAQLSDENVPTVLSQQSAALAHRRTAKSEQRSWTTVHDGVRRGGVGVVGRLPFPVTRGDAEQGDAEGEANETTKKHRFHESIGALRALEVPKVAQLEAGSYASRPPNPGPAWNASITPTPSSCTA